MNEESSQEDDRANGIFSLQLVTHSYKNLKIVPNTRDIWLPDVVGSGLGTLSHICLHFEGM